MQDGNVLEDMLQWPFYGHLADNLGAGHVARLREVSRGVKAHVDQVRRARTIRLRQEWFAGLPGTAEQKRQAVMERLGALVATGAVIKELALVRAGLDGTEPALLSAITPALEKLELQGNFVGGPGVWALHRALRVSLSLRSLTYLNLGANDSEVGSAGLARLLPDLLSLSHLALADCDMREEDAVSLAPALRQCRRLTRVDLSGNFILGGVDLLVPALALMPGLVHLNLRDCAFDDSEALAGVLAQCRALVFVNLSSCGLEGSFGLLNAVWPQMPGLAYLQLNDNGASARDMEGLADALPLCPALRQVCVHQNSLGSAQAVVALAAALAACPWLETLDVQQTVWNHPLRQWQALSPAHEQLLLAAWAPRAGNELWR